MRLTGASHRNCTRVHRASVPLICLATIPAQTPRVGKVSAADAAVQNSILPFVSKNCFACQNAKRNAGGLNPATLRTGEMTPQGLPRPADAHLKLAAKMDGERVGACQRGGESLRPCAVRRNAAVYSTRSGETRREFRETSARIERPAGVQSFSKRI